MKLLNRNKLLEKEKLEVVEVELEKGEGVFVRQMTGRERDQFEKSIISVTDEGKTDRKYEDFRAKLAVRTTCDEKGDLLFEPDDYEELSQNMSAFKLEKIVNVAQKLNMITEEDKEELTKN